MLYIVATPIGNLKDISQRAIETLQGVDFVLCENPLHSKKLLDVYGITTPLIAYHQHSALQQINRIVALLKDGKNLALITDAGTPGISDPGNKLVAEVIKCFSDKMAITPIPGACALTAALSISGFPTDKFLFMGFPPTKKGRKKFFSEVLASSHTVVFYESCHRILKTLRELQGADPCNIYRGLPLPVKEPSFIHSPQVVVCRELTKKFETIYRGTIQEVAKKIECDKVGGSVKGEFVVIIEKNERS